MEDEEEKIIKLKSIENSELESNTKKMNQYGRKSRVVFDSPEKEGAGFLGLNEEKNGENEKNENRIKKVDKKRGSGAIDMDDDNVRNEIENDEEEKEKEERKENSNDEEMTDENEESKGGEKKNVREKGENKSDEKNEIDDDNNKNEGGDKEEEERQKNVMKKKRNKDKNSGYRKMLEQEEKQQNRKVRFSLILCLFSFL